MKKMEELKLKVRVRLKVRVKLKEELKERMKVGGGSSPLTPSSAERCLMALWSRRTMALQSWQRDRRSLGGNMGHTSPEETPEAPHNPPQKGPPP